MATFYDLIVTRWHARFMGQVMPCAIGRGGLTQDKKEGDGATPRGSFRLLETYARADRGCPDTSHLPMTMIGPQDIWSDDPKDAHYNQHCNAHHYPFSHERLHRANALYDLFAVMDYNICPAVAGKGSAIFLHAWRRPRFPTEGCVALSPHNLRFVLANWTPRSRVVIT